MHLFSSIPIRTRPPNSDNEQLDHCRQRRIYSEPLLDTKIRIRWNASRSSYFSLTRHSQKSSKSAFYSLDRRASSSSKNQSEIASPRGSYSYSCLSSITEDDNIPESYPSNLNDACTHRQISIHLPLRKRMIPLNLIVAATHTDGIGKDGKLPWSIPGDMAFFKKVTMFLGRVPYVFPGEDVNDQVSQASSAQNVVIMGRKTWDSIPARYRPLNGRTNIVLSRNLEFRKKLSESQGNKVLSAGSLDEALELIQSQSLSGHVFLIGGSQLYEAGIMHPWCHRIFMTRVRHMNKSIETDVTFPPIQGNTNDFSRLSDEEMKGLLGARVPLGKKQENDYQYEFQVFTRVHSKRVH